MRYIKVLRGNFSAVDFREEPCHNGLSEKEKHGDKGKEKNMIKARGGKNGTLQAGQRKARFRRAFVFSFQMSS